MNMQEDAMLVKQDDESFVTFTDLVITAWRSRWAILILTLLAGLGAFAWALIKTAYLSYAFVQFGGPIPGVAPPGDKEPLAGLSAPDFSRYLASMDSPDRFGAYLSEKKLEAHPGIAEARKALQARGMSGMVEPVYSFATLDAKATQPPKTGDALVLGMRISHAGDAPEKTREAVSLLTGYAIDGMAYAGSADLIRLRQADLASKAIRLENTIVQKTVRLGEFEQRIRGLKDILARTPKSELPAMSPAIEPTKETYIYLPPATLIAATEVQAVEARDAISRMKRELAQGALLNDFYTQSAAALSGAKTGEGFLRSLNSVQARVFKGRNLEDLTIKEVHSGLTAENAMALTTYIDKSRIVVNPTPAASTSRPLRSALIGAALGFLAALGLVFVRSWWQRVRRQATA
jgi:hypothetical protein